MRISDWSSYVCSSDLTANRSRRSTPSISVRPARSPKRWARPLGTSERQRGVTNSKRKGCNMQNATTKEQAQKATNPVAYLVEHGHTNETLRSEESREGKSESVSVDLGGRRIIQKKK